MRLRKVSKPLIASVLAVLCSFAGVATATVMTWSRHNLNFEVPDNGFVLMNTSTRFEIQWDEMLLTVQLYDKSGGSDKKIIKNNLTSKALSYSMYELKHGSIKVKGFKGYTIDGVMPDGTRALIADLVSTKSNLIVEISINYLLGNREMAEDIIKSFAENETRTPAEREKLRQKIQKKSDAERDEQKFKQQQEEEKNRQKQRQRRVFEV